MAFFKSLDDFVGGSLGRIGSGVGSALNKLTGVESQQNKTYKQQLAAMSAQNAYNTFMWNLANQYNTPSAQLARMAEAGIEINPTSYALGTGNLSNTASVVNSDSGFAGSGSPAGNPIAMAMGVANGITGIKEAKQRIKNMQEQNTNLMEQGNILFNQMEGSRLSNEIARHNLEYAQAHRKPVGWTPSLYTAPVEYAGDLLSNYILRAMGR